MIAKIALNIKGLTHQLKGSNVGPYKRAKPTMYCLQDIRHTLVESKRTEKGILSNRKH